ncbi:MAG: hypothetical protein CMF96_12000 [Candidatus Marinimicrobia bacterium]|nr:hypothetical protein [Candidatus Neomarinimicrobiota bacterium]|tara:strand:+ start:922 stop:1596 length:675 start_codon:yes stop_codon:yes gene_type:complete
MQLNKYILNILLFICFSYSINNDNSILRNLNSDQNWELINLTDDSISVSIKYVGNNTINALKVEKVTNISLEKITNIIFDISNYENFLTNAGTMKTQILTKTENLKIAHQILEVDIPFFDNREYFFQINLGTFDPLINKILINWKILPPEKTNFQDRLNKDNICINRGAGIWKYRPIDEYNNLVQYILYLDPEGYLPPFIIDLLNKNSMITLFRDVFTHAEEKL